MNCYPGLTKMPVGHIPPLLPYALLSLCNGVDMQKPRKGVNMRINANFTAVAALLILFLVTSATQVPGQNATNQLQIDFATTAGQRILDKMRVDEKEYQTKQLTPRNTAEQLAQATYEGILVNRVRLEGKIEHLTSEYQRIAGSRDQTSVQYLNDLRNRIAASQQQYIILQRQEQS